MTTLQTLLEHALVESLGWTLLHFVWQGALVALAHAGVNALLADADARARYSAACVALALMLVLPVATFFVVNTSSRGGALVADAALGGGARASETQSAATGAAGMKHAASARPEDAREEAQGGAAGWADRAGARFASSLPWLVLAWLACVGALLVRLAGGWVFAARLRRERGATTPAPAEWQLKVAELARRMKVTRAVRLCRSALVEVPTVVGWLRPVILVPCGALAGMSGAQLEALLAHELAHVRRHDYLVNLMQAFVETVLFYHPAVWRVSGRVRAEREHVCDDLAVEATGDVLLYARALAALETLRQQHTPTARLALAADGGSLVHRIQRLIKLKAPAPARRAPAAATLAAAAFFALAFALVGTHAAVSQTGEDAHEFAQSETVAEKRQAKRQAKRRVAVTFVAMPMVTTFHAPRAERDMRDLIAALAARNVRSVGFVNAGQLQQDGKTNEDKVALLRLWLDAGHELGSEGYAHPNLFKTPLEDYKRDVLRGEELTSRLARERGSALRYFSYPYLNVGPDRATKESFEKFLAARGQRIHKVTIDNWDWIYGRVYADARRAEDEAKMRRVADEYVEYMERAFEFYETLSRDTLGYEPPQVLMLTANGVNCQKAGDLLAMLERRGYEFVSLDEAMSDPAYAQPDGYTGEWGISWLQRWAMAKGQAFREEPYLSPWMAQFDTFTKKWPPVQADKK